MQKHEGRGQKPPKAFRGVAIRTDDDMELQLDRLALTLSKPGERATRTYAARVAMAKGLALLLGSALLVGCMPIVESGDNCDDGPEPVNITVVSRATLVPETGAVIEAVCPEGYEVVEASCVVGPVEDQLLLFREEGTEGGLVCDVWNEDDVYARTAEVRVVCSTE